MSAAVEETREFELTTPSDVRLAVRDSGPPGARAVVGLHGLGGTRDSMLGGTLLQRSGLRAATYDSRGHGRSEAPADPLAYGYDVLVEDLLRVIEATAPAGAGAALPPLVVGASMGGLAALRLVLEQPQRVAGLVLVTPAFDPDNHPIAANVERSRRVSQSLRDEDLAAFVAAQPYPVDDPAMAALQRGSAQGQFGSHRDLTAVADAIDTIMVARPFASFGQLAAVTIPVMVVGSRDEFDRLHPLSVARAYAEALGDVPFACEPAGSVPFAWRARQLSRIALAFAREQRLL